MKFLSFNPVAFGAVAATLVIVKVIKHLRSAPKINAKLANLQTTFIALKRAHNDSSQYLRFSTHALLNEELLTLKKQICELKNIFLRKKINHFLDEVETFEKKVSNLRKTINERFYREEYVRAKHIFKDEKGNDLLTEEQIKAVLCNDNRNLVIAGAGSGKTRVIDFKVRYLVNHKNVSPQKILLLSFSKKSADDLIKKISENISGIEARTIHSLGSRIIGKHDRKLFNESHKELESFVIKSLTETLKRRKIYSLFQEFYGKFFSDIKPMIFYKSLDELRKDLRKINSKLVETPDLFGEIKARRSLKTLRGELVRSLDERYIADFLYLQNIKYEYEKKYPHSETWYYPDFYLPDYDTYLEHFAITDQGRPPPYFKDPEKYMQGIEWKRNLHAEKNTRLIESYSYLLNAKSTSAYLTELLVNNDIRTNPELESNEAYTKISKEFCRIFTKFYLSFKLSGLLLEDLKQKYTEKRYLLFLKIFEEFYNCFEKLAKEEGKFDFNDLIIEAIDKYDGGNFRLYDYIIVDEFQDTSNLAMKLLDKIFEANPDATLLSVGDDWQSIYGFNGSDVTILSNYFNRYSGVSVCYLNSNFRSHSRIVNLGKQFISKNPAQVKKNVLSKNRNFQDSEIDFLSLEQMENKIRNIPDKESIFVLYRYNDDCLTLLKNFGDFFVLDKNRKPTKRANCTKNISMMTIHASKGLEAQHVFLLFSDGIRRKFPSEIEDHFVFNMLKTYSDDFPFSEERRLLYVAITRAEQNLYFVSPNKDPNSVFWDELKELVRSEQLAL
jgi:DNA helicase-4